MHIGERGKCSNADVYKIMYFIIGTMNVSLLNLSFIFLFIITIILLMVAFLIKLKTKPYPYVYRSKKEKYCFDPVSGEFILFPSIEDPASINLSVIVPAYNEEERLPPMLDECLEYLEKKSKSGKFTYEVIIVSDGSTDKTVETAQRYSKKYSINNVRVLALETNRGKGGAVRLGMNSARGALLLFADADGATQFSDLDKLEKKMNELVLCDSFVKPYLAALKPAIVIGSRAHLEDEAIATRSYFRTFLMHGFHFLVWFFAVRNVRDTQCGFKLLTRQAARTCFSSMHVERWAFDVELLYIAQYLNIPIEEVAVKWTEIEGSKVTPFWSWLQMGRDLGLIWLRYKLGAWKVQCEKKN